MVKRGEIIELAIQDYAFGGKGISRIQTEDGQFVVFVLNAIPGQKVRAKIVKKKRRFCEAKLVEVIESSPDEITSIYQPISGAPFISLPIERQHQLKYGSTIDQYNRIGGIENVEELFDTYIESPEIYNYRNKMEYSFSCIRQDLETGEELDDEFALGFKSAGTWWKVENLDKPDGLFDAEFEKKLKEIRSFLEKTELPAWHPPRKEGFFRHLVVRKSFDKNQLLINLVTSSQGLSKFDRKGFADFIKGLLGTRLAGLQHTINDDVADRAKIENGSNQLLVGEPVVLEKILGLEFEISMESFFQTNPKCAELLYSKAIEYAKANFDLKDQFVMDLFCGTGTIGQIMANELDGVKVVGVDIVPEAIEDAKRNSKRNGVGNIDFYAADVGKFLFQFPDYENKIHTIILDPPRAGIAPKTLRKVMRLNARQIIYISCNPSTQARDAKDLEEEGYKLKKLSFVDQFPHTSHIEAVALFIKD